MVWNPVSNNQAAVYLDAVDGATDPTSIGDWVKSVKMGTKKAEKTLEPLGGSQKKKIPGAVDPSIQLVCYDDTAGAHKAFFRAAALSTSTANTRTFYYGPQGEDTGAEKLSCEVFVGGIDESSSGDDPHEFTVDLMASTDVVAGTF